MSDLFEPKSLTVSQVFNDGDPLYKIPNYQRSYSWTDEEVERLWDDIYTAFINNKEDSSSDINYFLGSLIVVKHQETGFEDVVDGQQRLTTLMILFNVVRTLFPNINSNVKLDDNPLAVRIAKINSCIKNTNEIARLRLYTHESHFNDFNKFILNNNDFSSFTKPTKKEIQNYPKFRFINSAFIFYDKLVSMNESNAGDFINYIFNKIKIIKISCSDRSFAIKLFQILNDRGLDLSSADLIKSILLASIKDEINNGAFVADWQAVEQLSERLDVNLTELFTFYEYYRIGRNPKKSLVDELEQDFKLKGEDANTIINDFKDFVTIYNNELFIDNGDKVIHSMWNLPWSVYWKTIVLTALHSKYKEKNKLILLLRRFYYLCWISGKTLSSIKQTSFSIISSIKENKTIEEINLIFETKLTNDKVIEKVLLNLSENIYFEPWVKPIFIMIEYKQTETDFVSKIEWDRNLQLEHILPQSFAKKTEWNHITEELGNRYLHAAGNLTLLSSKKNIEAQYYSFHDKIKIYQGIGREENKFEGITSFRISQKIVDAYISNGESYEWNENAMKERYNWFIGEIGEILNIDTSSIRKS